MSSARFAVAIAVAAMLLPSTWVRAQSARRDSAGITIVENAASLAQRRFAALSDRPVVTIGVLDGAEPYVLSAAVDAVRIRSGVVVVAERNRLRWYDSTGRYIRDVGRTGQGPGEFRNGISWVGSLAAGGIAVHDATARFVQWFDSSGEYAGATPRMATLSVRGITAGDRLIYSWVHRIPVAGRMSADPRGEPQSDAAGRTLFEVRIRSLEADNVLDTRIGVFPQGEVRENPELRLDPPFERALLIAAGGNGIFVGDGSDFAISRYDPTGMLTHSYRLAVPATRITEVDLAAWRADDFVARRATAARITPAQLRAIRPAREVFPAYDRLLVDATGLLWARDYVAPTAGGTARWIVFDGSGSCVGHVDMPAALRVTYIDANNVLGTVTQPPGYPQVLMYALEHVGVPRSPTR